MHVDAPEAGQSRSITADNFVIATGSQPRLLGSIDVDGERIITSDHVMRMPQFPKSMVILGAGVVGCEFATIFANYGQTKVYMIDRQERILPFEDPDIARVCATNLEARGVTVHHRAKLIEMKRVGEEVEYTIEHHTGGRETIRVDYALISIGRVPNTKNLGLEKVGVKMDDRDHIVDDSTQTSVPHIYAVGDVTYDIALVNVGEIEGRHAAELICDATDDPLSYDNLSTIMFLDPEVAAIGLNELQAPKEAGALSRCGLRLRPGQPRSRHASDRGLRQAAHHRRRRHVHPRHAGARRARLHHPRGGFADDAQEPPRPVSSPSSSIRTRPSPRACRTAYACWSARRSTSRTSSNRT